MFTSLILSNLLLRTNQDPPVEIPKAQLPKEAICNPCEASGSGHGMEKPAAGFRYKGVTYYFCNKSEVEAFKKDPESFVAPVLPRPMDEFALPDVNGILWNSASFKDRVVLIDFWATWCAPCKELKPIVEKVRSTFAREGFEVLSVSIDAKRSDLDKFLQKNKFTGPVLHDTTVTWSKWGVRSIPALFLVKNGQIIAQWKGKQTEKTLSNAVRAALPKASK